MDKHSVETKRYRTQEHAYLQLHQQLFNNAVHE